MEGGTVPRAIRNTIECALREHSIVMNRIFEAFRCYAAPFAHRVALPSQLPVHRFSCEHGICAQKAASEL